MGKESKIQWTEATWNPWHGCTKVSPGCKYCYMFRDKERWHQDPTKVVRSKSNFNDPLKWKEPKVIFTCSWSDWFHKDADPWRDEAWDIVMNTPHIYQILTKRVERMEANLPELKEDSDKWPYMKGMPIMPKNVWLGISVENNDEFCARWPVLESIIKRNGGTSFLSCEPLIGPLDDFDSYIEEFEGSHVPDWVIIGGESGNDTGKYRYRECKIEWIQDIISQCVDNDVPVFVKQLGTYLAKKLGLKDRHGGDIDEWPERFRIRQMPKIYKL